MAIFSNVLKKNFSIIPNEAFRYLNMKQTGMFCYLASLPDNWQFSSYRITEHFKSSQKTILKVLRELEELGFLTRRKQSSGKMEYLLHTPQIKPNFEANREEKKPGGKNYTQAKSHPGNVPPLIKKKEEYNKKQENKAKVVEVKKTTAEVPASPPKTKSIFACLLVCYQKKLEEIMREMREKGFSHSIDCVLKRISELKPEWTPEQIAGAVIENWTTNKKSYKDDPKFWFKAFYNDTVSSGEAKIAKTKYSATSNDDYVSPKLIAKLYPGKKFHKAFKRFVNAPRNSDPRDQQYLKKYLKTTFEDLPSQVQTGFFKWQKK